MIPRERTSRIAIVFVTLEICFGLLICRLFFIQFVHNGELRSRSERKRHTHVQPRIKRGKIFDRHGSILALNRDLVSVYADPKFLKAQPHTVAHQLAPVLNVPESQLLANLQKKKRRFVWLKRGMEYEHFEKIRQITKSIRGLEYRIEGKRFYPKAKLACHIIGYTNFENEGQEGIEYQYNTFLLNKDEAQVAQKPPSSKKWLARPPTFESSPEYGHSIILTIDEYIQYLTEKALIEGCKKWKSKKGAAIVMRSQTGEILAIANYPNYDLNLYSKSEETAKRNLAIWMQYEPGSVFKIVTASAVINEKVMAPDSREYCEMGGYRLPNGHIIHDITPSAWLTLSEIIQKSSNIGITKVANWLGRQRLEAYIRLFGFGQKTGIDLPYGQPGNLYALKQWDNYSLASVPFGQGISVTPIQMLNAINVIATDGVLLRPYVTEQVLDGYGETILQSRPKPVRRVISRETAEQMREILVGVTEHGGGKKARVKGYRVAGKTGTAQKSEKGKGYIKGKETTTFAGFLPAEKPQISIIVVVDESAGTPLSGDVAAPIFQRIAEGTIHYLNRQNLFAQRISE